MSTWKIRNPKQRECEISEELQPDFIWFNSFAHSLTYLWFHSFTQSLIQFIFCGDFHRQYFTGAGNQKGATEREAREEREAHREEREEKQHIQILDLRFEILPLC